MNKKLIVIVASILVFFTALGGVGGFLIARSKNNNPPKTDVGGPTALKSEEVSIKKNEAGNVEFEKFDNGLVSMDIPKGWAVTVHPGADAIHYTFKVENPKDPNYRIMFGMKTEGFLASEKERAWYASMYSTVEFGKLPAIDPQTAEQYFKVFNAAAQYSTEKSFSYPSINNFTTVENLGKSITGGDILRANYTDENGNKIDGIFTASPTPVSLYYVTAVNVYNIMFFTVPEGQLPDWEAALNHCASSIEFSDEFVSAFNDQEAIVAQTSVKLANIASQTSDIITSGWNNRQSTYDTISQKQSDATMGYERVYDTDTGDIYKADSGFMDHDWNGKYELVTDDMYKLPTSGYIEKVN